MIELQPATIAPSHAIVRRGKFTKHGQSLTPAQDFMIGAGIVAIVSLFAWALFATSCDQNAYVEQDIMAQEQAELEERENLMGLSSPQRSSRRLRQQRITLDDGTTAMADCPKEHQPYSD